MSIKRFKIVIGVRPSRISSFLLLSEAGAWHLQDLTMIKESSVHVDCTWRATLPFCKSELPSLSHRFDSLYSDSRFHIFSDRRIREPGVRTIAHINHSLCFIINIWDCLKRLVSCETANGKKIRQHHCSNTKKHLRERYSAANIRNISMRVSSYIQTEKNKGRKPALTKNYNC